MQLWLETWNILLLCAVSGIAKHQTEFGGKIWAFLAATSNGFSNYRHQADVCHAYQILHNNGIPNENIIVMMADDIAYNEMNPKPGVIINKPGGKNVYKGVPKDYTGKTVTPENFLNILSGNKTGMKGIGSGRVIESGPNDYIFVNFVDHGGAGILCFGDDAILAADDLVAALKMMADQRKFAKMFVYIEACHSGSMFDSLLSDDLNIVIMTAADPHENSFACYYDDEVQTYLADVFSSMWMHDAELGVLTAESMHHQYQRVRSWTNTSHVEEYGDMDIGVTKVSSFIGFSEDEAVNTSSYYRQPPHLRDLVSNADVPLHILDRRMENTKNETVRRRLKTQKYNMLKMREEVDKIVSRIHSIVYSEDSIKKPGLVTSNYLNLNQYQDNKHNEAARRRSDPEYRLHERNFDSYKKIMMKFSKKCFDLAKHPYARSHLSSFIPMCNSKDTHNKALNAISEVCNYKQAYGTAIY